MGEPKTIYSNDDVGRHGDDASSVQFAARYIFECVPSQNGIFPECLQAHQATVFASVISVFFGLRPVPLCEPSQNG